MLIHITIIFNIDDTVYMEKSKERDEYVLNDTGRVYVGKASKITGRPWNFGQVYIYFL